MQTTSGTLLGGRVRYHQPTEGYRTGIEPVLLAATIQARAGHRVLEAGTGAGAGLLCLANRIPGLSATGVEREPRMADLARRNAAENGLDIEIITADIVTDALADLSPFDHVFANPPWHDPASTRPAIALKEAAKHRGDAGLYPWVHQLAAMVAPRGTLSFILPAGLMGEAIALLHDARFGRLGVLPLWPRAGKPPKIVIIKARRGNGPSHLAAGLVLHGEGSAHTAEAEAILRGGDGIIL